MLSKKRNGWLWVVMLFAVCAVVYGMLSSYPRELAVYSDELRYLDVARSLLQGRGLRVRNMPSDYQKILYPLCILPALLLKTTAAQITAISIDSRQIYKNQFDKKEKDAKKSTLFL